MTKGILTWGADAEGGAPYVFPDPKNPQKLIGFEVDLAEAIAKKLGVLAKFRQNAWDSLLPSLNRGDFDMVINGIEITPERRSAVEFSFPYYIYTEQLVVRSDEKEIREFSDLKGKTVGTLSGAVAQKLLEDLGGVNVRIFSGQVEPYEDLLVGRVDAVLLDLPIAAFYAKPNPKFKYAGEPVGEGQYGIALRKTDPDLKDQIDRILADMLANGELKQMYDKWGIWNKTQEKLAAQMKTDSKSADLDASKQTPIYFFIPNLLKGAVITIVLSFSSMTLAIVLGLFLAVVRTYFRRPFSDFAMIYVEIYRGTPLLIQLYILYYGLPNIGISLSPWTAAIVGLGMNYAAYEAEIYRAGIDAVPRGQMEAALSLGMSPNLALRRVILPQAFKIALPGITNDFIALFKDSSLVSVIGMVELTKTYSIMACSSLRFFELGLIVALLYFGMSFPLSLTARKMEARLKGGKR